MLLSTLIVLFGFGMFIYVVIYIARSEREYETTKDTTTLIKQENENVVEEKKEYKYTDEEIDEAWELQVYLEEHNGELPKKGVDGVAMLKFVATFAITWYLYLPLLALWWGVNMFIPNPLRWVCWFMLPESVVSGTGGSFMIIVALLINLVIVLLAITGLCALLFGGRRERDLEYAFKEYSGRMKEALDRQDEGWQKEVDDVANKLTLAENQVVILEDEKDKATQLLEDREKQYKQKLNEIQDEYKREKRLWLLEKKELQYQIKLKQGLADEMDDSESPLGGLYN